MRRMFLTAVILALPAVASAQLPIAEYAPELPKGAKTYTPAEHTQAISILDERDVIVPVKISELSDTRWHQPGGMESIKGWRAVKYKFLPEPAAYSIADVAVENSYGFKQNNRAIVRVYPVGTRFDEVLYNTKSGRIFEHRIREKTSNGWKASVKYTAKLEFPAGYSGLKVSCASCHDEAGTGKYNAGLVPGGDTVLSDPLDWSMVNKLPMATCANGSCSIPSRPTLRRR
jgi:hypothetical protein